MRSHVLSRRGFMIGTGAGAAAVISPGVAAANTASPQATSSEVQSPRAIGQPMPRGVNLPAKPPARPSPDSVGYAIVGLGGYALKQMMTRIGQAKRSHIAALVSGNPQKLAQVGDAYGVPSASRYSYEDFDRIADDPGIDAVYIVLPSGLHCEFAERAFVAGKHVLCEKPMALSSAECDRMLAAAQRADKKLMIAYRCHFEPHNLEAMKLTSANTLGDMRLITTQQSYRMGPTSPDKNWRVNALYAGGGPLEDFGIYGLQAALYLSSEMPTSVSAATYRPTGDVRFAEIYAKVSAQLNFPSGLSAQISTSYDSASKNSVAAYGTKGALNMEPAIGYGGHVMTLRRGRDEETLKPGDPEVQFARQLDHLADAIRDGIAIRVPGEMGRRDVRLIEAIHAAGEQSRTIALNPDGTMRG